MNIGVTDPAMFDSNLNIVWSDWTAFDVRWNNSSLWFGRRVGFYYTHQLVLLSHQWEMARQWVNPKNENCLIQADRSVSRKWTYAVANLPADSIS